MTTTEGPPTLAPPVTTTQAPTTLGEIVFVQQQFHCVTSHVKEQHWLSVSSQAPQTLLLGLHCMQYMCHAHSCKAAHSLCFDDLRLYPAFDWRPDVLVWTLKVPLPCVMRCPQCSTMQPAGPMTTTAIPTTAAPPATTTSTTPVTTMVYPTTTATPTITTVAPVSSGGEL